MNTSGWDLVSVVPIEILNPKLYNQTGYFESTVKDPSGGSWDFSGSISFWKLIPSKKRDYIGPEITFQASIDGTMICGSTAKDVQCDSVTITTSLSFSNKTDMDGYLNLCFSFFSQDGSVPITDEKIQISGIKDPLAETLLRSALYTNQEQIALEIASVSPVLLPNHLMALPKPRFFYHTDKSGKAFLLVAGNADGSNGTDDIFDDGLFKDHPVIALSGPAFLEHVVLPQLANATYHSLAIKDYPKMTGGSIQLDFSILHSDSKGKRDGDGDLTVLVSIDDDKLQIHLQGSGRLFKSVAVIGGDEQYNYSFNWIYNNPVVFAAGELTVKPDPNPSNPPATITGGDKVLDFFRGDFSCGHDQIKQTVDQLAIGNFEVNYQIPVTWYCTSGMTIECATLSDSLILEYNWTA